MSKIIQIMSHPFGKCGLEPVDVLTQSGYEFKYNPFNRRLKNAEVPDLVREAHGIIAGTEPYTRAVLEQAKNVQVIARVGVGLDSIDFEACRERGIIVTYTPEAPADAVAELAVGNIINLARRVHESDRSVRERAWNRYMGSLLREVKIGILGMGRIGGRVARLLQTFRPQLLACDVEPDIALGKACGITWVSMDELFAESDILTLHVPLTPNTRHLVNRERLAMMKKGAYLINTARGPVVEEPALVEYIKNEHLGGAAIDVFEEEPYEGRLTEFDNVLLTAHMGASAKGSRFLMELGAAEDCVRVLSGETPEHPVTDEVLGLVNKNPNGGNAVSGFAAKRERVSATR